MTHWKPGLWRLQRMLARRVKEELENKLRAGHTVYLSTHLKHIKVTPKTFKGWEKAGVPLFKIDSEGNLRMGKNIICFPDMLLVEITV